VNKLALWLILGRGQPAEKGKGLVRDYFIIRLGEQPKEKALARTHRGFFFVAGTGLEPVTFGL
jgi:hypothetical protein